MAGIQPSEAQRRAALESANLDADLFLAAEHAAANLPAPTRVGLNAIPEGAPTFPTSGDDHIAPQACRPLHDHEWQAISDLVPRNGPNGKLESRDFVNALIAVVIGGHGWSFVQSFAPGTRERWRRHRKLVAEWRALEDRARLLLSDPARAWIERVAKFAAGNYTVRARRPDARELKTVRKFGKSFFPRPAEPWTPPVEKVVQEEQPMPHRGSKVRNYTRA